MSTKSEGANVVIFFAVVRQARLHIKMTGNPVHLYIAYKRYSSWSLRPWLLMKYQGIPFDETLLPFAHDSSLTSFAAKHRIPATVPVLEHNDVMIWDSLAIMEYLAECYPGKNLWPVEPTLRAMARSASSEMHSGFVSLRAEHPMNCHRIHPMTPGTAVQANLKRLAEIWQCFAAAKKPPGEFLCGEFGVVDAMFAPVALRVKSYQLQISEEFERWAECVLSLPAMDEWLADAALEEWRITEVERAGR